jgi:ribulose-phosphate 3-epimerase
MSVNPGFGGQSFIPHTINKLKQLKQILKDKGLEHIEIEVDGGVKLNNIASIAEAGADILVAGSAIYKAANPTKTIEEMNTILSNLN